MRKWPWSKKEVGPAEGEEITEEIRQSYRARISRSPFIQSTSYPIPLWELSQKTKRDFRCAAIEALKARFLAKTNISDMILRQLLSKDLGLKSWHTPPQTPGNRSVWVNQRLQEDQFIIITGVIQLSPNPKVSEMLFQEGAVGSSTLGVCEINEIYGILPILKKLTELREDDTLFSRFGQLQDIRMAAYFSEPYLYEETFVHISVTSPEGNKTGDRIMLSGFVIEPAGITIS